MQVKIPKGWIQIPAEALILFQASLKAIYIIAFTAKNY